MINQKTKQHKKQFKVVYDLDETLIASPLRNGFFGLFKYNPLMIYMRKRFYRSLIPNKPPLKKVKWVLTARNFKDKKITFKTLKKLGLNSAFTCFNPLEKWDAKYIAEYKAKELIKMKATHYVDSDATERYAVRIAVKKLGGDVKCVSLLQAINQNL